MKKNILLAVFCLIISAISFAQVPQKMSYQAVVRGSDNNLVTNHQVAMRVSILHGSADGTAVYTETHSATTNANGLVSIEIGDGTSNDDFTAINWANGPFFVKTETDVNGGDDYDIVGVSQLLSVPYAMYAQTAGNMPDVSGFLTVETDPTIPDWAKANAKPTYSYDEITGKPELFSGNYNDLTNKPTIPTVPTLVSAFTNDANYLQSESDPTIPDWAKANAKPTYSYDEITGKPELFSGNYNDLTNKPTIPTVPTNVSAFTNDANYVINETDPTVPDWAKANAKPTYSYDEITGKPELFSGNYNDLTNKPTIPTVPTNVSAFTNDANYVVNETDPTIPDWAKANAKPTYSYDEITGKPELFSGNYNDLTNKPTIPTVPTLVSAFTNDANYISSETQTLADVAALGNSLNTQLKNVTDPTDAQDAVTLAYLDAKIAELNEKIEQLQELMNTPESAINGLFSVSETRKVYFSKGNLQYNPSTQTWQFAANQYDIIGSDNQNISSSYSGWIDLFGWGTGSNPTNSSTSNSSYSTFTDWGNNAISNGGNQGGLWRTLTKDEWSYLLDSRPNAASLVGKATVNGVTGLVFLPDNWTLPSGCSFTSGTSNAFSANIYTTSQWWAMESAGAVFLPAAGYRLGTSVGYVGSYGYYWSSAANDSDHAWNLNFNGSNAYVYSNYRNGGRSVRLVRVVQN